MTRSARLACGMAAVLAGLVLASTAQAQTKRTRKGTTGTGQAPAAAAPAPASPAPAQAEPAAAPLAAASQAGTTGDAGFWSSRGPASMALSIGYFSSKGSGLAVQMDYGFAHTPPSWTTLELEWRLRAMYAMPSKTTDLSRTTLAPYTYTPVSIPTGTEKATASVAEIGPFARVRLVLRPKLAAFADLGAGIAQTLEKVDRDEMYVGHTIAKQNVTTIYVGGAVGMAYDLNERWRALLSLAYSAQPSSDYSSFVPSLGISYRL